MDKLGGFAGFIKALIDVSRITTEVDAAIKELRLDVRDSRERIVALEKDVQGIEQRMVLVAEKAVAEQVAKMGAQLGWMQAQAERQQGTTRPALPE